tara:strand:+ start:985 stop:1245 length:261 start_codon:yes stop_codon:yes gene_type:complete
MDRNNFHTKTDLTYDWIIKSKIATEKEIRLVTSIIGYNIDALNDIIFSRTAYQDMAQHQAGEVQSVLEDQISSLSEPIDNIKFTAW